MHKFLCTFPGFLKYPLSFTFVWPMFSSVSPDDSLTINIPPPIIISSYDTHTVSFPAYDRASKHDKHTFTSTLWLSYRSSQAVLWYFAWPIKITFSRTVRVHFLCTWCEYRDACVPEIGLCILLWLPFEVALYFSKNSEYILSSELFPVGPLVTRWVTFVLVP